MRTCLQLYNLGGAEENVQQSTGIQGSKENQQRQLLQKLTHLFADFFSLKPNFPTQIAALSFSRDRKRLIWESALSTFFFLAHLEFLSFGVEMGVGKNGCVEPPF